METLMVDRVHSSLRLFMYRNAIFLCERLCAQFPSEVAPLLSMFLNEASTSRFGVLRVGMVHLGVGSGVGQ